MNHRTPDSLQGELVQQHARGLRAIARGLLADGHAAEEVVQETWVAAIERPPVHARGIGGWLRQVTRRTALKRRRGETRRSRREHEASRPEALAPTDEVVVQREVLRRVMEAVLALEEPYQTVVLMRFYQDLPPREIARRRGVPVVTVNSQIQRALKQLRGRLDADGEDERGHWACALAAAIGWERGIPPATMPAARPRLERWAMDWRLWMGATGAAAVVAIGATAARPGLDPGARELARQAALPAAGGSAAQDEEQAADAGAAQSERRPAAAAAEPAPDEAPPAGTLRYELAVVVVDQDDRPVSGAHVLAAPRLQPLCDLGECDRDGRLRIAWLGDGARMTLALGVHAFGITDPGLRELELVAGTPTEVRIATRAGLGWVEEEVDLSEVEVEGERIELGQVHHDLLLLDQRFEARLGIQLDEAGLATFQWPADNRLLMDHNEVVDVQVENEFSFEDITAEEPPAEEFVTRVSFTVVDARLQPLAGVPVYAAARNGDRYFARTSADGTGAIEVRGDAVHLELSAGGGDFGLATGRLELMADDQPKARAHWRAQLDRGDELRGNLQGEQGVSFANWIVEFESDSGAASWSDTTRVAGAAFALPNLPGRRGALFLRASPLEVLPRVVIDGVEPGVEPTAVTYEVRDPGLGGLRVALVDDHGEPLRDADVRVWQLASGRAVRMGFDAESRRYGRDALPAGRYRVTAGSLENGYRELGQVEVVAGEVANLGSAALPRTGELAFSEQADELEWWLLRRAGGVETLVDLGMGWLPFEGRLPAGEYVLRQVDEQGVAGARAFEVRAGETTRLED